jgi:hypothetical protein
MYNLKNLRVTQAGTSHHHTVTTSSTRRVSPSPSRVRLGVSILVLYEYGNLPVSGPRPGAPASGPLAAIMIIRLYDNIQTVQVQV